ncbi:MAG: carbohydrate ABC transporter permease [Armatimonadota bacterium]
MTIAESRRRRRRRERGLAALGYAALSLGAVTMLLPLLWMLTTSLKTKGSAFTYPPEWIPTKQETAEVDGQEYDVFVAVLAEGRQRVGLVKEYPGGARVRLLEGARRGEEVDFDFPPGLRRHEALRPAKRVHFVWQNYPKAWTILELKSPVFAFRVPYALRVELFGSTWQIGPPAFGGLRTKNAFLAWYLNSLLVAVVVTFGQVATSALAAFAFARLSFPGRDKLFLGYLGTLMIPFVVIMIPDFILLKKLRFFLYPEGMIDTYAALILPAMFSAYGTFLLRQFFLTIPTDLEDAARIDGCSRLGIFWHVIVPLSKPALATLTTFVFLHSWNNYMWPLIVINSPEKKTLPIGLQAFQGLYSTEWTLLMAASMMVILPVLLVFIFNQRFFVRGIVLTGLKA